MNRSVVSANHAVVRLARTLWLHGVLMNTHGPHGRLRCLPLVDALALCEAGDAKLAGGTHIAALRDAVREERLAAEVAA